MSHTKFPEVVLHDDDGDGDLAAGAPMLVEALQLVESAQMFSAALRIAHHAEQLSAFLDTQRGANSSPSYTAMRAEAELKEQTQRHRNLLDSVRASFSTLQSPPETNNSQSSAHRQHYPKDPTCHAFARRADGLVLPQGVQLREMLLSQPFLDYERYTHCVRRLSDIVSDGKMFSACEPRLRILQGRHALFRAFSGWREDHYHPTLGGGDLACAPQSDLRRLETSVGASALVAFMEHLRQHEPQRLVSSSPPITVKKVMERYFGPTAPYPGASTPAAVTLSADGLGLRPNYAEDGGGPWLDMQDLARHAKEQPKGPSTQAAELLNAFIGMKNVEQDGSHQGELFAEFVVPALTRVVKSRTHPNASLDRLHLELTLTGREAGELQRIATWCARSGLYEKTGQQLRFCLLISQKAFLRSAEEAPATTPATGMEWGSLDGTDQPTLHFGHVLKHIFEPMWQALQEPAQHPDLAALLSRTTGISLSFDCSATVQEMPMEGKVEQFPLNGPAPPDAFFAFHVWRNVMMLNAMFSAHAFFQSPKPAAHEGDSDGEGGQGNLFTYFLPARSLFRQHRSVLQAPLMLRLHGGTGSRGLFMESVLGLLMADEIVNPAYTFEWSPLTYLYYLTQRHVVLSPSRNRRSSSSVKDALSGALPLVVQLGLHASIATIDPLFDGSGSFALSAEFEEVRKNYNLSTADVTEMSLRGLESRWTSYRMEERYLLWGFAWPRASPQENAFEATHVSALRLHHRDAALEHEMALVCRKGLRDAPMMMACQVPEVWATSTGTSLSSADGLTREERWRLLKSFFAIPSIKETPAGTSAMTWTPPQPLPPILHTQSSERSMLFPRIIIAGPDRSEPHRASKQVARALSRRQYYQSFAHMAEEGSVLRRSTSSSRAAADGTSSINPLHDGLRLPQHFAHGKNGLLDVSLTAEEKHSAITANYFAALPSWEVFQQDVRQLREVAGDATVQRYCRKRLDMLECKFKLHVALTNDDQKDYNVMLPVPDTTIGVANEAATRSFADAGSKPPSSSRYAVIPARKFGGDVYNCVKVDVHCHMAGGMTAKSLLDFIKRKLHSNADDVVAVHAATGQSITLASLFAELLSKGGPTTAPRLPHQKSSGSSATSGAASSSPYINLTDLRLEELTIASLQVQAGKATFNRFDQFNNRYNPMGISSLRSLFLKTENFMGGRYFAELIQETLDKQSQEGKTFSEYRLSIYGRDAREWERLANWFVLHGMAHQTNRWMVQVPRLFGLYRKQGILDNFQQMLHNIFAPLWEASIHPERHPFLHHFLAHVSGFDSVDNESDREQDQVIRVPPGQWTRAENPPFSYYMYFMWANCVTLNRYRAAKGLSTFSFRPHAGESGDPDHMADALLLADGVGHGINLIKRPVLQYLFYLSQIPLGIVPLSNNALFCKYADNPFPTFFRRGLNVALATDGALMFHHTEQPLIEEYSTAQNFWGLSAADICEIAKHSVVMSGFPRSRKEAWLGSLYALRSVAGNDESRSCVPMTRCAFRYEVYLEECAYLEKRAAMEVPRWEVRTPLEEELFTLRRLGLTRNEVVERRWSGKSVEHPSSASSRGCDATSEGLTPYRNSYRPSRL